MNLFDVKPTWLRRSLIVCTVVAITIPILLAGLWDLIAGGLMGAGGGVADAHEDNADSIKEIWTDISKAWRTRDEEV